MTPEAREKELKIEEIQIENAIENLKDNKRDIQEMLDECQEEMHQKSNQIKAVYEQLTSQGDGNASKYLEAEEYKERQFRNIMQEQEEVEQAYRHIRMEKEDELDELIRERGRLWD